jgi:hypothetical protein
MIDPLPITAKQYPYLAVKPDDLVDYNAAEATCATNGDALCTREQLVFYARSKSISFPCFNGWTRQLRIQDEGVVGYPMAYDDAKCGGPGFVTADELANDSKFNGFCCPSTHRKSSTVIFSEDVWTAESGPVSRDGAIKACAAEAGLLCRVEQVDAARKRGFSHFEFGWTSSYGDRNRSSFMLAQPLAFAVDGVNDAAQTAIQIETDPQQLHDAFCCSGTILFNLF